jgi:hypothetical protein
MRQVKIKVWAVAIKGDVPLNPTVHTCEGCALNEVVAYFAETPEEHEKAFEFLEANNFDGLRVFVAELKQRNHPNDHYSLTKQEITVEVPWPSDEGVSQDEQEYGVSVTADVRADSPNEAAREFVKTLQIGNTGGLTFQVSNLKTGDYEEISELHQ